MKFERNENYPMANCQAHLRWVTKAVKKDPLVPLSQCFHIVEVLETTKKKCNAHFFQCYSKKHNFSTQFSCIAWWMDIHSTNIWFCKKVKCVHQRVCSNAIWMSRYQAKCLTMLNNMRLNKEYSDVVNNSIIDWPQGDTTNIVLPSPLTYAI